MCPRRNSPGAEFEIVLNQTAPKAKAHLATETEVDLVKADLLVGLKKREQALEIYRDLARRHPGDSRIPEALGYLASYSGRRGVGSPAFRQGRRTGGSQSPAVLRLRAAAAGGRCRTRSHQGGFAQGYRSKAGL